MALSSTGRSAKKFSRPGAKRDKPCFAHIHIPRWTEDQHEVHLQLQYCAKSLVWCSVARVNEHLQVCGSAMPGIKSKFKLLVMGAQPGAVKRHDEAKAVRSRAKERRDFDAAAAGRAAPAGAHTSGGRGRPSKRPRATTTRWFNHRGLGGI